MKLPHKHDLEHRVLPPNKHLVWTKNFLGSGATKPIHPKPVIKDIKET